MSSHHVDVDTSLLFQTACNYLDNGIGVAPCSFKKHKAHVPIIGWKSLQQERLTRDSMQSLFQKFENDITGICVFSGQVSNGLVVRDFDDPESFEQWLDHHRFLASVLPILKTRRGGHVYFYTDKKYWIFKNCKNGEYRGTSKQYSITSPSLHHKSMQPYEWLNNPTPFMFPKVENPVVAGLLTEWNMPAIEKNRAVKTKSKPIVLDVVASCTETVSASFLIASNDIENKARIHQPKNAGERNRKILAYVRSIKGLMNQWTHSQLKRAFDVWWNKAVSYVETKTKEVSWNDFQIAFTYCHSPQKSLDTQRLAESSQKQTVPECIAHCGDKVKLLAKACKTLQQHVWPESFYLSREDASEIAGASPNSSWGEYAINLLINKGVLTKTKTGNRFGEASEYRWIYK